MDHKQHLGALRAYMLDDLDDRDIGDDDIADTRIGYATDNDGRPIGYELVVELTDGTTLTYQLGVFADQETT